MCKKFRHTSPNKISGASSQKSMPVYLHGSISFSCPIAMTLVISAPGVQFLACLGDERCSFDLKRLVAQKVSLF
jgi:hypothetical protein